MLKKVSSIFSIIVGISIIGMWGMFYFSGQIVELSTKPIDITFHLINEFTTAILLLLGGYGLLRNRNWAARVHFLSMGMLLYSLLTANGYFTQKGVIPMTILFSILTIITVVLVISSILSKDKRVKILHGIE
jgi:hypothetical protein